MADTKVRAWVQRLMRGDIRTGDLNSIFLYARDRPDGRNTVKEIGDFVAHHTERQKGLVTAATRDWLSIVLFHAPHIQNPQQGLDRDRLPAIIKEYLIAMKGRLDPAQLKKRTGFDCSTAARKIDRILNEMTENIDGTFKFRTIDKKKINLLNYVVGFFDVRSVFGGEKLVNDLFFILKSAGAITGEEIKGENELGKIFQLFAVSAMHNCRIKNSHQDPIRLSAMSSGEAICVNAAVKMPGGHPENKIYISSSIFTSTIKPNDGCDDELLASENWDRDIEVSSNGKLSFIS